jgi:hypothetical protein
LNCQFRSNPTNPQTRGIRPAETCPERSRRIIRLFPNCRYEFHKITLAPPIARRIVPISWMLALFLESLKIFNSHYLVAIRPRGKRLKRGKALHLVQLGCRETNGDEHGQDIE